MSRDDKTRPVSGGGEDDRTRVVGTPSRARARYSGSPAGTPPAGEDDWALPGAVRPQAPLDRRPPPAPRLPADGSAIPALVEAGRFTASHPNPVLEAAAPLLATLGGLRMALINTRPADLMGGIAEAITGCERAIRAAGIDAEQAQIAKYILSATADDIVQNLPGDQHVWTQYSMLSQFFGERDSGVQFFKVLDRLRQDPARDYGLLELQHACLALGFEGQYRSGAARAAGGGLEQVRRGLYETLRRVRRPEKPLSPHWEGAPVAAYRGGFEMPLWGVTGALGVLLFGAFLLFRTLLGNAATGALALAGSLQPGGDVTVQRQVVAPPPAPLPASAQLTRVRAALAGEIAAGRVSVQQTADRLVVHLGSVGLFAPAEAQLEPAFATLAPRLAAMLDKEAGPVRLAGHTDNSPLKSLRFASNTDLSLARANAVAAVLRRSLREPDRLQVEGRGPDEPVATNDTAEGRAQNRRVDISFQRVD